MDLDGAASYVERMRPLVGNRPLVVAAAGVLVWDDRRRILLQQRSDDHTWCIPGALWSQVSDSKTRRVESYARKPAWSPAS
jgi:hypothetical protein